MTLRKRLPGFTPGKRRDVDMTEGNITRHIISFALPLLIGNIFQQLYNMVDTWVVGNYVNIQAYSAVGTVGPIVNMLIGFFMGLSSGAGVVISQYYGAQQPDKVKQTVHTALLMTLILGVIFTAVGILITPTMLQLINMPPDEAKEATTYLTIYFAGILGLMFYNIGAGILRAVGDSQRPFYFLVVSAVMNIVLDLVFVLVFNMGVAGVALATIIAQSTSAVLIIITLLRSDACIKLIPKELKIHWGMLKKIFTVGIPAALQMAITSFSNIFVQSYINYFGGNCMAGWTTYAKVDQLLFLPMQSISLASTTFVGQNLGRNQAERARQGVKISLLLAMGFTAVLTVPVVLFAQPIVTFFIKDSTPEALSFGTLFLQWLSPFYLLCCFNQIYSGALRGAGNSRAPMIIMLSSFVAFRQVYLFIMAIVCNEILPIALSYPAGWLVCSILTAAYYHKVQLTKTRLVEEQQ
jgi:putative MATE family efflux protein